MSKVVEIKGFNFSNKGAFLMLLTTLKELDNGSFEFACKPGLNDFQERTQHGLLQVLSSDRLNGTIDKALAALPASLLARYGIVRNQDIDAIIDISGFALGDYWGERYPVNLARKCKKWRGEGKKIVFMPQAFGPFSSTAMRTAIAEIIANADRIYARDEVSFRHLTECANTDHSETIRLCNDMTIGYSVSQDARARPNTVAIVPNNKVYDRQNQSVRQRYIGFLVDVIGALKAGGKEVDLIVHDSGDTALSKEIAAKCSDEIDVVSIADAVALKRKVGSYDFIVASRYHALVAALSQNVPAIAIGWSHKYTRLLCDYGLGEWSFSLEDSIERFGSAEALITNWLSFLSQDTPIALAPENEKFAWNTAQMWADVRSLLSAL